MPGNQDYQVALSFAGEQRDYVEEVARHLAARSIAVFYDGFEAVQLWGKDAAEAFHEVYSDACDICRDVYLKRLRHQSLDPTRTPVDAEPNAERGRGSMFFPFVLTTHRCRACPTNTLYLNAHQFSPAELSAEIARKLGIPAFAGKASDVPPPRMTSPVGDVKFDYSSYNGRYVIGSGAAEFETNWSKASNRSIHVYNDPTSIHGVAIHHNVSAIYEVTRAATLDYTSRARTPTTGQVVVLRNKNGFYAAVQVLKIKDDTRGDENDELHFRYAIQVDGTDSFERFRDVLER